MSIAPPRTKIVTPSDFIGALKMAVLNGSRNGLLPETMAIALRLEADEQDDKVPASRVYK